MATINHIEMAAGDTEEFIVSITDFTTLGSAVAYWSLGKRRDGVPLILRSSTNSSVAISGLDVTVTVQPRDTINLKGNYVHELRIYEGGTDPLTVMKGRFKIKSAITNQST